jgi:MATE family multidrug resistance protein
LFQNPIGEFAISILQPEADVVPLLRDYISYRIWAAPATISVYVFTGWFLGMQDSKSALVLAVIINGVNAALSYYLVYEVGMQMAGVALGTVIAQYIGFVIAFFLLAKKYQLGIFKLKENLIYRLRKGKSWKEFLSVNSDILIRTLCLIFTLSFFKAKAANIDPVLGAANILLLEFISLSAYGIDGFAFAAESISGKYFGKKDKRNLIRSIKYSFIWGIGIAIGLSLLFLFLGEEILQLLTDKQIVVEAALPYLFWLILAPIVNSFAFIWDGIYIGTTASSSMRNTMLIATIFVFLPAFYLFFPTYHNHGLWFSLTLFMLMRGLLLTFLFKPKVLSRLS